MLTGKTIKRARQIATGMMVEGPLYVVKDRGLYGRWDGRHLTVHALGMPDAEFDAYWFPRFEENFDWRAVEHD